MRSEQTRDYKGCRGVVILGGQRPEESKILSRIVTKIIAKNEAIL